MNNTGKMNKSKSDFVKKKSFFLFLEKNKNKAQNKFDDSEYFTTCANISSNLESEIKSLNSSTSKIEPAYKCNSKKPLKMNAFLQNYNEQPVYAAK